MQASINTVYSMYICFTLMENKFRRIEWINIAIGMSKYAEEIWSHYTGANSHAYAKILFLAEHYERCFIAFPHYTNSWDF